MRGIERIHKEAITSRAQYELVTGPNPLMADAGIHDATPLATAEILAAFKDAMQDRAAHLGLGGISFKARMKSETALASSGLHINTSLWGKSGQNNLFYESGKKTTDLERHVIDSLIETHASSASAYLPHAESFERVGTTARGNPLNPQFWWEVTSGVPNHAGYMDNKGVTLGNLISVVSGGLKGKPPIGSIAGRHSNHLYKPLGLLEGLMFRGKRAAMIGWEKPHQYRLESRLAGADADPYVAVAAEMASVYEAVAKHTRPFNPAKPINHAIEKVIDTGGEKLVVDLHKSKFDSIPLPRDIDSARSTMARSDRIRELLGEDLYHGIMDHAGKPVSTDSKLGEAFRESRGYAEKHLRATDHETTDISTSIRTALGSMPPLRTDAPPESWAERVKHNMMFRREL